MTKKSNTAESLAAIKNPFGNFLIAPSVVQDHGQVLLASKKNIKRRGSCVDAQLSFREYRRKMEKLERRAAKKGGSK